jgi:hypothetical protein
MVRKVFHKSLGSRQVQIKGRGFGMTGSGMGSLLLGTSGSGSAMVNGPTPAGMLGNGLPSLHSINLKSEGNSVKKKLSNIKF